MDNNALKRYAAEVIGTAVLVLVGCGAVAIGEVDGRSFVDVIGIAFAFGLAVTAMAYGIGPISGCHINPAVTVGMITAGRMPFKEGLFYILSQSVGAIIGAGLLVIIVKGKLAGYDLTTSGLGQNGWGEGYLGGYGLGSAILVEFLATLIFLIVILGATNPTTTLEVAGLIIGLTLFALHFPFINVTGLSVNPAQPRSGGVRRWQGAGAAVAFSAGPDRCRRCGRLAVSQPDARPVNVRGLPVVW